MNIPPNASFAETYGKALKARNQKEADEWLEALVSSYVKKTNSSVKEALKHIRRNLWNFACHTSNEAMITAEQLYGCRR